MSPLPNDLRIKRLPPQHRWGLRLLIWRGDCPDPNSAIEPSHGLVVLGPDPEGTLELFKTWLRESGLSHEKIAEELELSGEKAVDRMQKRLDVRRGRGGRREGAGRRKKVAPHQSEEPPS